LTLKMIDTFTSIFLAVLWFNTFTQFMVTFEIAEAFPCARELISFIQVVALYAIANFIAYLWKDDTMRVTTFCSCGAHMIAFAGIAASGHAQGQTSLFFESASIFSVFAFVGIVGAFLAFMFFINHILWKKNFKEHHVLNEALEELELDVVGLVISFLVTQAVRAAITGSYPTVSHFLQADGTLGHAPVLKHQAWQRLFMLVWAVVLCVGTSIAMPKLNEIAHGSPTMHKAVHISKVVLIMLIAWGFLLWGQWEFYEHLFEGDLLFGQMVFACCSTFVCLGVLYVMGNLGERHPTRESRQTFSITTTGISLVAAWSWEHCFNCAFDIIGQKYQVGYKGLVPKLVLSIVIPICLLPTYLNHVRPRVLEHEEEHAKIDAQGHGHGEEHGHGEHGHAEHA